MTTHRLFLLRIKWIVVAAIGFWFFSVSYATITIEDRIFSDGRLISDSSGDGSLLPFAGPAHEAEYFQEMQGMAEQLGLAGRVHWPGFVHDMPKLMREVNIVCLPSEGEGMANIVLEAIASGVPFVVTPCSGMNELVGLGGGLIAEPDPKDLASKIDEAFSNNRKLGESGRSAAIGQFSSNMVMVMKTHLKMFKSLLSA